MSKFSDAFRAGQEAFRSAERARADIRGVFDSFAQEIKSLTDNSVWVTYGIRNREKKVSAARTVAAEVAFGLGPAPERERYRALIAERIGVEVDTKDELCEVKESTHGWPVRLIYPGNVASANDIASLEAALAEMVSQPDVAGKIARLQAMQTPLPAAT
jgi:hypothetical protein